MGRGASTFCGTVGDGQLPETWSKLACLDKTVNMLLKNKILKAEKFTNFEAAFQIQSKPVKSYIGIYEVVFVFELGKWL